MEFSDSRFQEKGRCDSTAVSFRKTIRTYLDGISQSVDSLKHGVAAFNTKFDFFTHVSKSTNIVALARDGFEASLQSCSKHDESFNIVENNENKILKREPRRRVEFGSQRVWVDDNATLFSTQQFAR